ncbi:response regulator [Microbacterium azadirachtae]|uniref:response regulator n=1 Tax=Microbacterium azadirachtae TaxID=582680 RepID=UPI00088DA300|nr:response regulator transcription factor [Microbacterium azadirachtae]SDL70331.1 DNA-binding response regulator, NarL/FixJ family, contains REC and HTH domains [Microbacterium azadirachtae]SEG00009.1 DNA-binding response regulator, NarL/FixJ family, contains REC and HTH domains [Microbacterium azadirachtae]SEG02244.1 DNA-binding response regulator, NarL/FixJ family, contains REC and HTH domains [Microbacterium azadirachtae]
MTPLTLLVVDDHPVVRDGIVGMVGSADDITVIGEASDGAEAVALAQVHAPDVVLMDLRMPRMDGVAALREFSRLGIASRVVVLTTFDADADVLPAIAAGATGYLLKDASRDELLHAIRAAAAGRTVLAPEVASRLVDRVRTPEATLLTPRELEILGLIADGATNRAAGDRLHLSEATVKTHLLSIYGKLGVGDRAAAVAEGFRRGLLDATR